MDGVKNGHLIFRNYEGAGVREDSGKVRRERGAKRTEVIKVIEDDDGDGGA